MKAESTGQYNSEFFLAESGYVRDARQEETLIDRIESGVYKLCESCKRWNYHSEAYFDISTSCDVSCTECGQTTSWAIITSGRRSEWQQVIERIYKTAEEDLEWLTETS